MKTILIDTNFYADIMVEKKEAVHIARTTDTFLLCPIVTGELLYGFKNGAKERENTHALSRFLEQPCVEYIPLTYKTSEYFALITTQLKKNGAPIPTHDIWIAACAMEHAVPIATRDNHFKKIPNLLLVSYHTS